MARKKENTLVGCLVIIIGAIVLLQVIGWKWFWIGLVAILLWFIITAFSSSLPKYPTDEFGPIFPTPQDASKYFAALMKDDPRKAQRLRKQQILRESLQIALLSKNPKTSQSRMDLAEKTFEDLRTKHRVPKNEWIAIEQRFLQGRSEHATVSYINAAQALLEKGAKLKTEKSRQKYLAEARATIEEGLHNQRADHDRLRSFLNQMPRELTYTS